jgi:outer membrane lipoprotein carrier protein
LSRLKSYKRVCLALSLLLCAAPLTSQSPESAILRKVDDHYNHLTSLKTHYREHYSGMGMNRAEEGILLLKKPGRMRWSYADPVGKVFVLDGKFAWFYTPGDPQVQRIPAKQLDDLRSPLRFLLGHTQLSKELEHIVVTPTATGFRIAGTPKGMAQRLKLLALTVTATGSIQQMSLEEIDGSVTEFAFSDMQENMPVKDSDFTFTPPEGVTIVEGISPI